MGGGSSAVDIEDGRDEPAPPPGFCQKKYFAWAVVLVLVCSVAVTYQKYGDQIGNEPNLHARHLKFQGDSSFAVTDAGHHDKMLLQLHIHSRQRYSLLETSHRTIRRKILLPDNTLVSTPTLQKLRIGLSFFAQDADLYGLIDDDSDEDSEEEESIQLVFVCTEFSIMNREQELPMSEQDHFADSGIEDDEQGVPAVWKSPGVWQAMADATVGKQFEVTLFYNGSVKNLATQPIHQAVVEELHKLNALPIEMTYKLQVASADAADDKVALPVPQCWLIGTHQVLDGLGAQWNAAGSSSVRAPLRFMNGTLCLPPSAAEQHLNSTADDDEGWLAVVSRGTCTFLIKARNAQLRGAVGMVVINDKHASEVLMAGKEDADLVPAILISHEAGDVIREGWSSGQYTTAALLAGHEAVGRHNHAGDGSDSDEFLLPDFIGYDNMIEEEVNRFFSIFPPKAVGVGDTWQRSMEIQKLGGTEKEQQTEQYTMLEMPPLPADCAEVFGSEHGLCGNNRHGRARIAIQSWSDSKPTQGIMATTSSADEVGATKIVEHGELVVNTYSGLIETGFLQQNLETVTDFSKVIHQSQRLMELTDEHMNSRAKLWLVLMVLVQMGRGAVMETKLEATTNYTGTQQSASEIINFVKHDNHADVTHNKELNIATWNIAAINNNPFEYWITYDDSPVYQQLMVDLENVMQSPGGERDVQVDKVFTQSMFDELMSSMAQIGWKDLDQVEERWHQDFKQRKIVEGFLREPTLGKKRLASMPDRFTNTIALSGGKLAYRPTVINCFSGDLSSQEQWFKAWKSFFFEDPLLLAGEEKTSHVYEMLSPIHHSKYPAITPEEEAISLPLQMMCQGIFDAILVHLMNELALKSWQPMKQEMCQNLNLQKVPRTIRILEDAYVNKDVILLQEVSSDFVTKLTSSSLASSHHVVLPANLDSKRDQNSIILLHKGRFPDGSSVELTGKVEQTLKKSLPDGTKSPLANGDLLAIETTDDAGNVWTLASFHGDTNGLASVPVLTALYQTCPQSTNRLVFGLDANTYEHPGSQGEKQGVDEFAKDFVSKGMNSCWGTHPDKTNYTTCNARTFLQPQLNKACPAPKAESDGIIRNFDKNADVNLKDYILFYTSQLKAERTVKDNTGKHEYREGMFFPTMSFPSDHGILSTKLTMLD